MDEGIPWMVGGETRHAVEVARMLAYAAGNADEGIVGSKDLEVRASGGAGLTIYPGAAFIVNQASGATYQSYAARWPTASTVSIAATGSGAGRSDMVIARIENPYETGSPWPDADPAVKAAGNAVFRRVAVISGVDPNLNTIPPAQRSYSAIPLAMVTLPASTTTVSQANIRDLRRLTNIRSDTDDAIMSNFVSTVLLTSTSMTNWPPNASMTVNVPPWTTHALARVDLSGITFGSAGLTAPNVFGGLQLTLGSITSQVTSYNVSGSGGTDRTPLLTGDRLTIPPTMRGTTQTLRIQGRKDGGNTSLAQDVGTTVALTIRWQQKVESNV